MPLINTSVGGIWYADHRDPTVHRSPLVLIHGAGGSHLDWSAELRRMPEANALIPDLPGHGKSTAPARQSVSAYAGDLVAFLDTLKLPAAIFAGQSMGGAIAQTLALNYPARVKGIILIGTGAKLGVHPDLLNTAKNDPPQAAALATEWGWAKDSDEQLLRLSRKRLLEIQPETTYGDYVACNAFDVRDQLERINAPTLIIAGDEDRLTPHKFSVFLHEHIAGSKLVTIPGGGHRIVLEQPQAVANAVQEWLLEIE